MELTVIESYDSHLTTIWKVMDGWRTIAICYSEADAEVCKTALEKFRVDKELEESRMW